MEPIDHATWQYAQASHIAREYDEYFADLPLFRYDTKVLDDVLTRPGTVIDLGCGTGRHVVHLARRGFDITGIDLSPFMLDVTREKLAREHLSGKLYRGSITDLSRFENGSFCYAICMFSTLGLVGGHANRRQFLKEVRRVLEPGGVFVVHVHNRIHKLWERGGRRWLLRTYLLAPFSRLEVGDMVGEYRGIPDMYLHSFRLGEVKRLLRGAGLTPQQLIPLDLARGGPLHSCLLVGLRANGYIVIASR